MSPGAIAMTAIVVSGAQMGAVVAVGGWLIYTKRILFAATPKPQAPQQAAQDKPADPAARRTA